MSYIGIDVGSYTAGWAIVDENRVIECGCWRLGGEGHPMSRLRGLMIASGKLARSLKGQTDAVGIEMPWVGPNNKTAILLAQCFGVVFASFARFGHHCIEVFPGTAKAALTGDGRAGKDEMRAAAKAQFNIEDETKDADISDAIAVALGARKLYLERKLKREAEK